MGEMPRTGCYTTRLDAALGFAANAFRHRVRKGSGVPYLTHLLQVMVTVAEHGADEDVMIAALLHDYLEDIESGREADLTEAFGQRVTELVLGLSEATGTPKPPWLERKQAYIAHIGCAEPALKMISAADKLHNARSLRRDLTLHGDVIWTRFTGTRKQTLWYYRQMAAALGEGWDHVLLLELQDEVERLTRAAGEPDLNK